MLGKRALYTVAAAAGSSLLTGSALYAFELNHLTTDAQSQIQTLTRQIQVQEVSKIVDDCFNCVTVCFYSSAIVRPVLTLTIEHTVLHSVCVFNIHLLFEYTCKCKYLI